MFEVCAGPATTKWRPSSGLVRYVAVWQIAQLLVTRGKPTVFLAKPTGSSWPASQGMPKAR